MSIVFFSKIRNRSWHPTNKRVEIEPRREEDTTNKKNKTRLSNSDLVHEQSSVISSDHNLGEFHAVLLIDKYV